jgi:putative exosortase-associated protein (TIGR04073 family)
MNPMPEATVMSKRIDWKLALGLSWLMLAAWTANDARAQAIDLDATDYELPEVVGGSRTKGPYYHLSENELRARKLARGIANVGLCVAEIPNQAFQEAYRTSPVSGAVVGMGKGLWKGIKRLAIGTWEIATFYIPGANNYQPYIEPEVVFMEYTE